MARRLLRNVDVRFFLILLALTTTAKAERATFVEIDVAPIYRFSFLPDAGPPHDHGGVETDVIVGRRLDRWRFGFELHLASSFSQTIGCDSGSCFDNVHEISAGPSVEVHLGWRISLGIATLMDFTIHDYRGNDNSGPSYVAAFAAEPWLTFDLVRARSLTLYLRVAGHFDPWGDSMGMGARIGLRF